MLGQDNTPLREQRGVIVFRPAGIRFNRITFFRISQKYENTFADGYYCFESTVCLRFSRNTVTAAISTSKEAAIAIMMTMLGFSDVCSEVMLFLGLVVSVWLVLVVSFVVRVCVIPKLFKETVPP